MRALMAERTVPATEWGVFTIAVQLLSTIASSRLPWCVVRTIAVVAVVASAPVAAVAADLYWDVNGTTANGDGSGNLQNGSGSRTSNSSSGTATTFVYNSTTSGTSTKSMQFGFGTTESGNLTNGGTVGIGSSVGTSFSVASMVLNASGSVAYTFQNQTTTGGTATLQLNTGGGDVPAGYGLVANANIVGDTTFRTAAGGTFRVSLNANQSWQNNSPTHAILMNVPVIGNFSLTTDGAGTIVLGGANTFSGGLTVSAGTLRATNANSLGTGSATVGSAGTLDIRAAITKDIANSGTVRISDGGSLTTSTLGGTLLLGGVSGTAAFTSTRGTGALELDALAGTGNSIISLVGGTQITATGALDFTGASNLIALTGAEMAPGAYTLFQGSSLTNTAGLSLTGAAVRNASIGLGSSATVGRNTYEFTSSANALLLNVTGTIYNLVWDAAIASGTWNDTDATWLPDGTGSPIAFVNDDNTAFNSAATVSVPSAVSSGLLVIGNASGSVDLSGAGSVAAYSLTKSGAGAAAIANATTLSTGLTVSGGSLTTSGAFLVNGGGITVDPGATMTLAGSGTVSGGLSINGGALVIDAAHTLTGLATISNAGSLSVNAGTLGTGTVSLDNGTLATGSAVSALANPLTLGANGGTVANDHPLTLSGTVAGAGKTLTKSAAGLLTLSGQVGTAGNGIILNVASGSIAFAGAGNRVLAASTFNGDAALQAGTLTLAGGLGGTGVLTTSGSTTIRTNSSDGGGTRTISLPLTLDGAVSLASSSDRAISVTGSLAGSGTVTTSGNARVNLRSTSSTFSGSLVVNHSSAAAGITEVSTRALANATSVTVNANSGRVGLSNLEFNNTATGTYGGLLVGAGNVSINSGSQLVVLTGTNSGYTGTTLLGDDVAITNTLALGTGTVLATGPNARLFWYGESGTVSFANPLSTGTVSTSVLAFAQSGKTWIPTGAISGAGQLKASTGATLDLTSQTAASNTNTGGIEVGNAYVRAASDGNLGGGPVNFSGTVLTSGWISAATATISRPITIGASGTNANVKAVFDTDGNDLTLTGGINDKAGTALGQLVKQGLGTLTLSGSNGYSGDSIVSAGMLRVDGTLGGTGTVTVAEGAVLGGTGTISGATAIAGIMAPGNSIGTLTVTSDLVWSGAASAGSTTDWLFELGAGNTSDLVNVTGVDSDFLRNSSTGSIYRFDFGGSSQQGTFTLVSWEGTTDFVATDFSYTNLGDGNTASFVIQGNTLTAVVVPEPATLVLAALGVGGLLWARLRTR